jgi:phosphoglucomutase
MAVMQALSGRLPELSGQDFDGLTVSLADEFSYQDPVDGSLTVNQGLRIVFGEQARIVVRLSGTGTRGATLRLYLERYERAPSSLHWQPAEALAPLANLAEKLVRIAGLTDRNAPDVVT